MREGARGRGGEEEAGATLGRLSQAKTGEPSPG